MMQLNKVGKLLHLWSVSLSLYSYLVEVFFSPTLCCEKLQNPSPPTTPPKRYYFKCNTCDGWCKMKDLLTDLGWGDVMYFNSIKAFSLLVWKRGGAKGSMWTHGLNASSIYKIYEYTCDDDPWGPCAIINPDFYRNQTKTNFGYYFQFLKMDHQCKKKKNGPRGSCSIIMGPDSYIQIRQNSSMFCHLFFQFKKIILGVG